MLAVQHNNNSDECNSVSQQRQQQSSTAMHVSCVTGAARGIGLEYVKQLAACSNSVVIAVVRAAVAATHELHSYGSNVHIVQIDVGYSVSIAAGVAVISSLVAHVDLLINNAAIAGTKNYEDNLLTADLDELLLMMRINTIAPLAVIQALHPLLCAAATPAVVCNISSRTGSMVHALQFGLIGSYRVCKAALNSITATLAHDDQRCIHVVISPGHVATDMGSIGGRKPPLTAAVSVAGMLLVLRQLTQEDSGKFYNFDGSIVPW